MQGLQISRDLRFAEVDSRIVFLNLKTEDYLVLDPVASAMWREVSALASKAVGPMTLTPVPSEIVRSLQCKFDVDTPRLERDFEAFIRQCVDTGHLVESDV